MCKWLQHRIEIKRPIIGMAFRVGHDGYLYECPELGSARAYLCGCWIPLVIAWRICRA
jgi:hypothetical protein